MAARPSYMLLLGAAAMVLAAGCSQRVRPVHTDPVRVTVMEVAAKPWSSSTTYVGRIEAAGTTLVGSTVNGRITSFKAEDGKAVREGDILVRIDAQGLTQAHKATQAALRQAQDGCARLERLKGTGAVPEIKFVEAQAQLQQAQAAEAAARKALDGAIVRAPFDGVVGKTFARTGVEVTIAEPLFQIHDVEGLDVKFPVPENEISSIELGQTLEVEVPATGSRFPAAISAKGIVASTLSHTYDCTARVSRRDVLPGMVCKVRVHREGATEIVVPASAVRTDTDGRYVWTVEDGTVFKVPVKVGGYCDTGIVIATGLSPGDLVVTEGARKISSGMVVITQLQ